MVNFKWFEVVSGSSWLVSGGVREFYLVSDGFRWFQVVPRFSQYVFNHCFIQIRFGVFKSFCFSFMRNKYYLTLLILEDSFFLWIQGLNWWETYAMNLDTKVKVFHKSISCFMKCPWNCASWNALKEKFHSVSLP